MLPKSRRVVFSLFFMLVIILGAFLFMIQDDEKIKDAIDHTTKLVYPDLKVPSKLTSPTFQSDLHIEHSSTQHQIDGNEDSTDLRLQQKIDQIINKPQLEGALVGISVRKSTTGELLYSNLGDVRLRPASNMKILTAVAALETLGVDYRFSTDILTDGEIKSNILEKNIYLRGQGDPTILKEDFHQLAQELKEQGIDKIVGNIIGDDSWYDDVRYSQDLNWSDEYNYTGAAVSALTVSPNEDYDAGTVVIRVYPSETIGDPPEIKIIPETNYIKVINHAKTVRKNNVGGLTIDREHGTNNLIINGSITANSPTEVWRSVWEPTDFAIHIFKDSLEKHGISLSDQTTIERGKTPEDGKILATKKSIPLKELLIPFMKLSNNGHGEILVKEMGKVIYDEGSWGKGLQVMEEQLAEFGLNTQSILLRDGSGMSSNNLIPPNEITLLLFEVQDADWFQVFKDSQPIAGHPDRFVGGTLSHRLTGESTKGKVKAKTGTLTGVSTLSGYLTSEEGEQLIFSIMINNYIDGWMPSIQDAIVQVLAEHHYR